MRGTITGRIPQGGLELREYARDAVRTKREWDAGGAHLKALLTSDTAAIEKRIFDHYTHVPWWRVVGALLDQFLCGLRGHHKVLHFEGQRVMMRCTHCHHDSPGWDCSSL
jgi:hypothetical protein